MQTSHYDVISNTSRDSTVPNLPPILPKVIELDQHLGHTIERACSTEDALAFALVEAAKAGQWAIVAQLAKELEARRLAGSSVVALAEHGETRTRK